MAIGRHFGSQGLCMSASKPVQPPDPTQGLRSLHPLLKRLRDDATSRDKAHNRTLFYDDACALLLLTFFNPTIKSLRDIQAASRLAAVRKKLGCSEASLGSLSESLRLFDLERLVPIIEELLGQIGPSATVDPRLQQ